MCVMYLSLWSEFFCVYDYCVVVEICSGLCYSFVFFFKQKTAYEMRISDWSSDVCSSDLPMRTLWGSDWIFDQSRYVVYAIYFLQFQNLWWSVANLLPIRPLDGGNVTAELFGLDSARRISIGEIGRASCRERGCQYVSISVVAG